MALRASLAALPYLTLESATVERPVPGMAGLMGRARGVPADTLAIWVFAALAVIAVVGSFVWVTYPNYDSYYALVWGREALHGHLPSFEAYRAPTEHPLAVVFGAALSVLGTGADRLLVIITILAFVALAAGTYRLGRLCFTPFVGALAAFLVLTRFDFPSLAVRAYVDIPFMATIVWAGALEVARPRRGVPVFLLLAAAGLMRPEAWLLSGVYFLWMSWDASWRDRGLYAALTAIGPLLWVLMDFAVTGNPLFSLTSTQDLAAELERQKSGGEVVSALPAYLRGTVKTPVYFAGLAGLAIAVWRFPVRTPVPLVLFCVGAFTFVATGLAGLSVIVRYLLVPSVMLSLFAAVTLGGWTMLPRRSRSRRLWAGAAAAATILGLAYTTLAPPSLNRFNSELTFRGDQGSSLHALLDDPAVTKGLACGPVSVPTHKLTPDVRWVLDLPEDRVVARSDPSAASQRRARYGVALFPTGRTNVLRTGFAVNTDALAQVPAPGFRRVATDRYFAAYVRCPPGRG
jgi:hypothetical protein